MLKRTNQHTHDTDVSPRTREILSTERYYGNGPPQWRVGKAQHPAQTAEEADHERQKLVKQLRRYTAHHPGAEVTAHRLDSCFSGHRCYSGACPECSRAYTRWFVASGSALLEELGTSISALSLVHADLSVPVGELTPDSIIRAKKKVNAILINSGITTFIGGIDVSSNEDEDGDFDPHFQIQSWVLAPADQVKAAERQLRKLFPKTQTTPRPVKIKPWDNDLAALGYALKSTFQRRVSYLRESSEDSLQHSCRNTRDRHLRVEQHIELAITLDRVGLHARLHLGGCRVVHTESGPMIRLIKQ